MCGIVGVINHPKAVPIILGGLKALEYRGYDSAGIFITPNNIIKSVGRVKDLSSKCLSLNGFDGIGHTRWATHGKVCELNAHPHTSYNNLITLVHNGVISNYQTIKEHLKKFRYSFYSETDTEVLTNLLEYNLLKTNSIKLAIEETLKTVKGELAIAFFVKGQDKLYFIKKGSPLVIGKNKDSYFVASDPLAIKDEAEVWYYPNDNESGYVCKEEAILFKKKRRQKIPFTKYNFCFTSVSKGKFTHYMKKEIFEEVKLVGRIKDFYLKPENIIKLNEVKELINKTKNIEMIGCGSSHYASSYIASLCDNLNIKTTIASEFSKANKDTLYILISQSGETYDLIQAANKIRKKKAPIILITNSPYSTLTRLSQYVFPMCSGYEIAVAASKSYISSIIVLRLLLTDLNILKFLNSVQKTISNTLENADKVKPLAKKISKLKSIYFIGKGSDYELLKEGALKLKEISYIHAESLYSGELKHGPIATVEKTFGVLACCTNPDLERNILSSLSEVAARNAPTYYIGYSGKTDLILSKDPEKLKGLSLIIYLQLLSYETSNILKRDIDKPRNLAKSVTVV